MFRRKSKRIHPEWNVKLVKWKCNVTPLPRYIDWKFNEMVFVQFCLLFSEKFAVRGKKTFPISFSFFHFFHIEFTSRISIGIGAQWKTHRLLLVSFGAEEEFICSNYKSFHHKLILTKYEKNTHPAWESQWMMLNGQTNSLLAIKILTVFNRFYNLHFKLCLHSRARARARTRARRYTLMSVHNMNGFWWCCFKSQRAWIYVSTEQCSKLSFIKCMRRSWLNHFLH